MKKNYIDVEIEVAVRKYKVDEPRLKGLLKESKGKHTNQEIADALGKPKTEVEHWFRSDRYFAIPSAEIWFRLKEYLGIKTDEFDASITEYEYKGGRFDMQNRIYFGRIAPTLTTDNCNNYYLLMESDEEAS